MSLREINLQSGDKPFKDLYTISALRIWRLYVIPI